MFVGLMCFTQNSLFTLIFAQSKCDRLVADFALIRIIITSLSAVYHLELLDREVQN